jgi:hypothetical protein
LKPFDFAEFELTTLTGDAAGSFDVVVVLLKGEGEAGPAAPARFRVLVDRAREGRPDGDRTIPVLDLLIVGEAKAGIEDDVADLGIGDLGRGF